MLPSTSSSKTIRIAVMGSVSVGKSTCTLRFTGCHPEELSQLAPTIEDLYKKQCVVDGEKLQVEIVDTAGQEVFEFLHDQYYRNCDGFLFVYDARELEGMSDVKDLTSFSRVLDLYQDLMQIQLRKAFVPCVFLANKMDLVNSPTTLEGLHLGSRDNILSVVESISEARAMAGADDRSGTYFRRGDLNDLISTLEPHHFMQGSALKGENIEEAFLEVLTQVREERQEFQRKLGKSRKAPIIKKKSGLSQSSKSEVEDDLDFFRS